MVDSKRRPGHKEPNKTHADVQQNAQLQVTIINQDKIGVSVFGQRKQHFQNQYVQNDKLLKLLE